MAPTQLGEHQKPLIITDLATNVKYSSATLNGTVSNTGAADQFYFQYSSDPAMTPFSITTTQSADSAGNVAIDVSDLESNTTYYYRIGFESLEGSIFGSIQSFVTPIYTGSGYTYYIDSEGGNDMNSGKSPDTPWQTLSKIYTNTFGPGETILLKRGGVWTGEKGEYFKVEGESNNPVVISTYGRGKKPVISGITPLPGWDKPASWESVSGFTNVWKFHSKEVNPGRLWLNKVEVLQAAMLADVGRVNKQGTKEWWYYGKVKKYDGNTKGVSCDGDLVFYLYSEGNPATHYSAIEGNHGLNEVFNLKRGTKNLIIEGLDFRGGRNVTLNFDGVSNVTLKYSSVGYGYVGLIVQSMDVNVGPSNNVNIEHNAFDSRFNFKYGASSKEGPGGLPCDSSNGEWRGNHDGISLVDAVNNTTIRNNIFSGWGHTTVYIHYNVPNNKPQKDGVHDNKVYYNLFDGSNLTYGRPIGTDGPDGKCHHNQFFNNVFKNHSTRSQINGNDNWVHHNIFDGQRNSPVRIESSKWGIGQAILLSVYANSDKPEDNNWVCHDNKIENNLFLNTDEPALLLRSTSTLTNKVYNNLIRNNIFYNTGLYSVDPEDRVAIKLANRIAEHDNVFQNNCIFNPGNSAETAIISYYYDKLHRSVGALLSVAGFNNKNGDAGNRIEKNIQADPMFVDYLHGNYHLQPTSPCIGAGPESD